MSLMGYAVVQTGTPELWLDDGYAQFNGTSLVKVCGLTQVDSIAQSGTGVITVQLSGLVNVVAVHPTFIGAAGSGVAIHLVSVAVAGTNSGGNASVQIILQVVTASSGSAINLTSGQGVCLDIRYTRSNLIIGSAPSAGMCVL